MRLVMLFSSVPGVRDRIIALVVVGIVVAVCLEDGTYDLREFDRSTEVKVAVRAPKRYVQVWLERPGQHVELGRNGRPVVVDPTAKDLRELTQVRIKRASEHGLPYVAPKGRADWIAEGFEHLFRLGNDLPTISPDWQDEPAIIIGAASLPKHASLHPEARPYSRLALSQVSLLGTIVAPWHEDFDPHLASWFDLSGREVQASYPGGRFLGETLGQAIRRVWHSADESALDPEGIPANHDSEGLLSPAPVVATVVHRVGKESRHLGSGREVLFSPDHLDYGADDYWPDLLEALSLLGYEPASRAAIAAEVEISTRWLEEITFRKIRPSPNVEARILTAVSARAREWIHEMHSSIELSRTEVGILSQYLELSPSSARRCHECGRLFGGLQEEIQSERA
jgi:hypothetical protein